MERFPLYISVCAQHEPRGWLHGEDAGGSMYSELGMPTMQYCTSFCMPHFRRDPGTLKVWALKV